VLENVPGLFLQSRYGNHDVRISIRGFGSRSNTGIRGVRILLDGIPESEPDGQTRIEAIDFNSVGSIELVKGNSSSLYTNAPGGVINFINDIHFPYSFATQFNEFGSFDLRRNGIKVGVRTDKYAYLNTYSYHNYKGFRPHSQDYWHIYNTVLDVLPGDGTNLQVLGYFAEGVIFLPGSLNKAEFEEDPYQAAPNEVARNSRRETTKGRLGLVFNTEFGENNNQEIEITGYGTIKYFHRVAAEYRIMNRYGLGASFRYINRHQFGSLDNEFSVGGDILYQTGPIELYENIGGVKGDQPLALTDETIGNSGFYLSDYLELWNKKLYMLLTGRYDNVYFDVKDQWLAARSAFRRFTAFTPKAALNYKLTPYLAVYTSFGLSFDSPAGNELDYLTNAELLNPNLNEQNSKNFEIGMKGNIINPYADFIRDILFELTLFNIEIESEIIPFGIGSEVYYRNAARTTRRGIEAGVDMEILSGLRYQLSYTYSDFVYDSYEALSVDATLDTSFQDYSGNITPTVPEHNAFTSLAYAYPFTENITGFVRGSYRYISGMFVDDANSDKTEAYSLLNFGIGADLVFGRFNLLLNAGVNNIMDEVYVAFININSNNGRFYEAGEPINYYAGLNLGYAFN
jgi:iron complex outermembrane receptor protein